MEDNVKNRFELCRKCLKGHVDNIDIIDIFINGIIYSAIDDLEIILKEGNTEQWYNVPAVIAKESNWMEGFADNINNICSDCKFKFEHTVMDGETNVILKNNHIKKRRRYVSI